MKEAFEESNWQAATESLVAWAEKVTDGYMADGYTMSLRQLYYIAVSQNILANKQSNYEMLGDIVTKARMAGRIDWDAIVDRNRRTIRNPYWENEVDAISAVTKQFRIDKWLKQPAYIEVIIEKSALEGVIQPVCSELDVPFTSSRGYGSATLLYDVAHRMRERCLVGQKQCHIIYLGDLDPSGVDITRDLKHRVNTMAQVPVHVHRVALTMEQVEEHGCPPNFAKTTDPRSALFRATYGDNSWELDALAPPVLADLVRRSTIMFRDEAIWKQEVARERGMRETLQNVIDQLREDMGQP